MLSALRRSGSFCRCLGFGSCRSCRSFGSSGSFLLLEDPLKEELLLLLLLDGEWVLLHCLNCYSCTDCHETAVSGCIECHCLSGVFENPLVNCLGCLLVVLPKFFCKLFHTFPPCPIRAVWYLLFVFIYDKLNQMLHHIFFFLS